MKYKANLTQIGSFELSGKMRVSDPCYKPDVWCCGTLNTRPGTWDAAVMVMDNKMTGGWGDRVAVLAAKHEDCITPLDTETINNSTDKSKVLSPWKMADFEVGVDSGQAGFYDDANFVARNGGDDEDWYDSMCEITLSSAKAATFSDGVVTRSGYGDGGYPCIYRTGSDGLVEFVYVIFIGDESDEDWEEDEV